MSPPLTSRARWIALAVLLTGGFLPPADFFIVNVALPSIHDQLRASPSEVQLVMSGYAAGYAVFLITGGRLGDLYGRRLLFVTGMAAFTATSVLCGVAWSAGMLVLGRILEGVSAAMLIPQVLGSIRALFADTALARALSLYAVMTGLAAAAGQLAGGVLVAADLWGLGWRTIFLVNLPIGAVAIAATFLVVPETSAGSRPRLDLGGAALISAALACLILPLSEGRENGWPLWAFALLAAAPVLLLAFLWYEDRLASRGGMPLVDLGLLAVGSFRRGILIGALFFTTSAFYAFFAIYQQSGLGDDPLHTGLAILPYGIGLFLGPLATGWLPLALRQRMLAIGMVVEVIGYAGVTLCVGWLVGGVTLDALLFIGGFGQGSAMPRLFNQVLRDVSPHQAGLAAGILNSMLQIGAALSVAGIGSLFFVALGGGTGALAYGHALRTAMAALTSCLFLALLLSLRERR